MHEPGPPTSHGRFPRCGARTRHRSPCRWPAGWGTDHLHEGRCSYHGGRNPIKHGRYSTITRPAIKQRLDAIDAAEPNPLDLIPELKFLRALVVDFIERYDAFTEALLAWHESFLDPDHTTAPKPRQVLDVADASRLIERISRIADITHKM
jgi:hypothetical protein